jgi:ribonuclease HII
MTSGRLVIGIDDAGRGCIFGPLFIGGVSIKESDAEMLRASGVKDSKLLSPSARERLYDLVLRVAKSYVVIQIPPEEVDEYVKRKKKHTKLNYLEAIYMGRAIGSLEGEVAYVDASDSNVSIFASQVKENLSKQVGLVAVHHADRIFPVVSAASIIAKVRRDREIRRISSELGDFGSGYPSDPKTIEFLRRWVKRHREPPPYTRQTWRTWKRIDGSANSRAIKL